MTTTAPATHTGSFYSGARQYAAQTGGFVRDGLERGHRSLVMAPAPRIDQLRSVLGRDADEVTFVDDTVAYAPQWNAYRVLLDFASDAPGVRCNVVAEQTLAARTPAEVLDYRRLEAAVNLVFAEHDVDLLCPYDVDALPSHLLDIGWRTHGALRVGSEIGSNERFDDPHSLLTELARVVPPPTNAETFELHSRASVSLARRLVRERGLESGVAPGLLDDLALAATEVITNALMHGGSPARLHLYDEGPMWVCHVQDGGPGPLNPLAGLLPPPAPADHGYGLWLARQLCSAVDVGSDWSGTHVRLHVRADRRAA